jgi:flagellar biogenesis protein FliO
VTAGILSYALVFGLIGALALWARRGAAGRRRLDIVETAALGQGRSVAVVRAGSKRLLIGVTGQAIATLAELDAEEWPEARAPARARLEPLEIEAP